MTSELDLKVFVKTAFLLILLHCEERVCDRQHYRDGKQQKVTCNLDKFSRGANTHTQMFVFLKQIIQYNKAI